METKGCVIIVFIPVRLRDEDFATCLVRRYLAAGSAGRARYFGAYFELIGGGGDRPEVSCTFTAEDLLDAGRNAAFVWSLDTETYPKAEFTVRFADDHNLNWEIGPDLRPRKHAVRDW